MHKTREIRLRDTTDCSQLSEAMEDTDFFVTPCTAQEVPEGHLRTAA